MKLVGESVVLCAYVFYSETRKAGGALRAQPPAKGQEQWSRTRRRKWSGEQQEARAAGPLRAQRE